MSIWYTPRRWRRVNVEHFNCFLNFWKSSQKWQSEKEIPRRFPVHQSMPVLNGQETSQKPPHKRGKYKWVSDILRKNCFHVTNCFNIFRRNFILLSVRLLVDVEIWASFTLHFTARQVIWVDEFLVNIANSLKSVLCDMSLRRLIKCVVCCNGKVVF